MVKNKKKAKEAVFKFGSGLRKVLMVAASHPVTASLAVMTLTVITKEVVTQGRMDTAWRQRFNGEMGGLYDGAQKLGAAAAITPAVVATMPVIQSLITARKQPT